MSSADAAASMEQELSDSAIDASKCSSQGHKKVSRKWSEEEVLALSEAICRAKQREAQPGETLNWADIAKSVPGRTGKQCREKYKNDLRPDISKDPWVSREEYILARAHSVYGNQWAEIAKFLPGRSENSIKNHWNATLRSKAESRTRTFLWAYGRTVLDLGGITSRDAFQAALQTYVDSSGESTEPLECFQVPEDYFHRAGCEPTKPPRPLVPNSHKPRAPRAPRPSRKRSHQEASGNNQHHHDGGRCSSMSADAGDESDATDTDVMTQQQPCSGTATEDVHGAGGHSCNASSLEQCSSAPLQGEPSSSQHHQGHGSTLAMPCIMDLGLAPGGPTNAHHLHHHAVRIDLSNCSSGAQNNHQQHHHSNASHLQQHRHQALGFHALAPHDLSLPLVVVAAAPGQPNNHYNHVSAGNGGSTSVSMLGPLSASQTLPMGGADAAATITLPGGATFKPSDHLVGLSAAADTAHATTAAAANVATVEPTASVDGGSMAPHVRAAYLEVHTAQEAEAAEEPRRKRRQLSPAASGGGGAVVEGPARAQEHWARPAAVYSAAPQCAPVTAPQIPAPPQMARRVSSSDGVTPAKQQQARGTGVGLTQDWTDDEIALLREISVGTPCAPHPAPHGTLGFNHLFTRKAAGCASGASTFGNALGLPCFTKDAHASSLLCGLETPDPERAGMVELLELLQEVTADMAPLNGDDACAYKVDEGMLQAMMIKSEPALDHLPGITTTAREELGQEEMPSTAPRAHRLPGPRPLAADLAAKPHPAHHHHHVAHNDGPAAAPVPPAPPLYASFVPGSSGLSPSPLVGRRPAHMCMVHEATELPAFLHMHQPMGAVAAVRHHQQLFSAAQLQPVGPGAGANGGDFCFAMPQSVRHTPTTARRAGRPCYSHMLQSPVQLLYHNPHHFHSVMSSPAQPQQLMHLAEPADAAVPTGLSAYDHHHQAPAPSSWVPAGGPAAYLPGGFRACDALATHAM